jgi:pSer/pThr/pTyr-binding forkhead associated (FHA) protein
MKNGTACRAVGTDSFLQENCKVLVPDFAILLFSEDSCDRERSILILRIVVVSSPTGMVFREGACFPPLVNGTWTSGGFMDAELIVIGGNANKAKVSLKLPTVIGRSRGIGLTVAHRMVSRRHCEVYENDGVLMVRDLGSLNGTLMDGKRIKEAALAPDAEFCVGPLTFRAHYHYEGDLDKLPAPVFDESAPAASGEEDILEVEGLEEPVTELEPERISKAEDKKSKIQAEAPPTQMAAAPDDLSDDLFDEFLKGSD